MKISTPKIPPRERRPLRRAPAGPAHKLRSPAGPWRWGLWRRGRHCAGPGFALSLRRPRSRAVTAQAQASRSAVRSLRGAHARPIRTPPRGRQTGALGRGQRTPELRRQAQVLRSPNFPSVLMATLQHPSLGHVACLCPPNLRVSAFKARSAGGLGSALSGTSEWCALQSRLHPRRRPPSRTPTRVPLCLVSSEGRRVRLPGGAAVWESRL